MNTRRIFFGASLVVLAALVGAALAGSGVFSLNTQSPLIVAEKKTENVKIVENITVPRPQQPESAVTTSVSSTESRTPDLVEYAGPIQHVFFHSLIIYPEKALADAKNVVGYKANMITVSQFKQVLEQLYKNNFILIDTTVLYSVDEKGNMSRAALRLPAGKKPLILSVDDLSYYSYMKNGGFARKLVVEDSAVKTEVVTPTGKIVVTADGDVVPIVDAFVKNHPDFSFNGAKGIIAVTGFEGVLGYRTNVKGKRGDRARSDVAAVVEALKKSGWIFASHSYSHNQVFLRKTITKDFLDNDISRWKKQVEPVVGQTNIFIGPFGQVFSEKDPRRKQLLDAGFTVLYGVGMDGYLKFFNHHLVMNRVNIDGYRLSHNQKKLKDLFGIVVGADF